MAGVVHIQWYATVFRKDDLAADIVRIAPFALRYGASQYAVHRSNDDRYLIRQMVWFESNQDWYRYWDGPEMIEFRRRNMGRYQTPISYVWHEELAAGALGPEVPLAAAPEPEPEPTPQTAS